MKKIILVLSIMISCIPGYGQGLQVVLAPEDLCPDDPYFLIFSEEFDGNALNSDRWYTYFPFGPGDSDSCVFCRALDQDGKQVFLDENVLVADGMLRIITKKEPAEWMGTHRDYTSGVIYAKKTSSFQDYQRWEARIRLPARPGFFPAFWAFGAPNEIDFFEYNSTANWIQHASIRWLDSVGISDLKIIHDFDLSDGFHTYAAEYDPYHIRFYFDGQLVYTVARLWHIQDRRPLTMCSSGRGRYFYLNPSFPVPHQPMSAIVNNSISSDGAPAISAVPDTMEVDYIRIYGRGCPWAFWEPQDLEITEDETIDHSASGYIPNYNYLKVADGKTLTIRSTTVQINDHGDIMLGTGSGLILDNATITSCNPYSKWGGIVAGSSSVVEITNGSVIDRAKVGVSLGDSPMGGVDPSTVTGNPLIVMNGSSVIRNCDIGMYVGAGATTSYIDGGRLENNNVGILAESSRGLVIDGATFTGNTTAINSIDSYMHIRDGNAFYGGEYGVLAQGTYPGGAGIQVGNSDPAYSTLFSGQNTSGVDCFGLEHPAGAYVVNCRFTGMGWGATLFGGANNILFRNNTVESSPYGFQSEASGDNFNTVQCNVFDNISGFDIHYAYNNSRSQFLGNEAIGIRNTNTFLVDAVVAPNVGSAANPAGNCFSSPDDIVTLYSKHFNYHYYNNQMPVNCEYPIHPGNYTKVGSNIQATRCEQGIGVFNLIDPDGDGVKGFSDTSGLSAAYSGHITTSQVSANIAQWIDEVVREGGDDPRTLADETTDSLSTSLFEKEAILDQWIRYAVLRGMAAGNYAYAESVLSPLKKVKWQHRLFGLKLLQAKYGEAQLLLASLPGRNTDEAYFKEVQAINIKRLYGVRNGQTISPTEMARLETIARAHEPSSAYARSIYHLLTGELIRYNPSLISAAMTSASGNDYAATTVLHNKTTGEKEEVTIYPNPAGSVLHITGPVTMTRVELMDIHGNKVLDKTAQSRDIELNLEHIAAGVYIVKITDVNGKIQSHRTKKL